MLLVSCFIMQKVNFRELVFGLFLSLFVLWACDSEGNESGESGSAVSVYVGEKLLAEGDTLAATLACPFTLRVEHEGDFNVQVVADERAFLLEEAAGGEYRLTPVASGAGNIYILGKEFRNVPVEVDGGIVSFLIVGNEYIVDGTLSEEVSLAIREELSRRSPQAVNLLELAYASLSGGTYYYLGLSTQEGAFSVDGTGRYTLAGDVDGYDSWSFSIETGDPYYVLEQDLTAYYQELYPEEGIDCVAIRSRCEKPAEYYWFEHYFLSALVE